MALNIKIDLENCYPIEARSFYQDYYSFQSNLKNGEPAELGVRISDQLHPLIPNVHNLSFGPLDEYDNIDDMARLDHEDHSKVFSTILLSALTFLAENHKKFLGIDGSNNARAYLYYRCIQNNIEYLGRFFKIFGVKYYVRLLRENGEEDATLLDCEDIIAKPITIQQGEKIPSEKLYNYFIFKSID